MTRRLLLAFAWLLAASCSSPLPRTDTWPAPQDGSITRQGDFMLVSGVGKADPALTNKTQRRSTSRDAAILEARARLLDYLKRIMLPSGASIGERATEDEGWRRKLEAAAAGIEVAGTRWDDGDAAVVTLRVERSAILRSLELDE